MVDSYDLALKYRADRADARIRQGLGCRRLLMTLQAAGPQEIARMREYVADHLRDIFASNYTARISLREVLQPDVIARYNKRATGEKFLIDPSR